MHGERPALWLLLAGLVLLFVPGSAVTRRVAVLARAGRLAGESLRAPVRPHRFRGLRVRGATALAAAVAGLLGMSGGPALAVAAAASAATGWALVRRALAARRADRVTQQVARALQLVIVELEAGSLPAEALGAAAGLGGAPAPALAAAALALARGGDAAAELVAAGAARDGLGSLAAAGHAVAVAEITGAPLAAVLSHVVADLAAERDQRRAVAVALAGPRSSATLLAGLPVLGIALGAAMGAHPLGFLLGASAGRAVCAAGVLLDLAGVWWIAGVLARAARRSR